ncbi:MAG TPA: S41 family peptidase [Terriglobia bacterium]|nr:S41 family peptidase [Terriglobia bacterium]
MKQTQRLVWFILSTVLLCALLGGLYGQTVVATTVGDDSDVQASFNAFTKVYDVVEQNYADPLDPDSAIFGPTDTSLGAIPGMLRTLDPHSNFFDPTAFTRLREDQEGKYFGVGMSIRGVPGKLGKMVTVVVQPMPGSPAFRAGIHPGDIIVSVNGQSTDGLSSTEVATRLKGPKGTVVHFAVSREGSDQPVAFTITRDEISRKSVDAAFFIKPGIAYIRILSFNETTNDELTDALNRLGEKGIQGLILDLRGNPGGLLNEAVQVTDHFLERNQLIVYHYGRRSPEKKYIARNGNDGNEYPMVVLINRFSASAAEIVTGALQDHDRALVMGEPSFGKGLVQTVMPLSEHTALALTTAHYYTPSGRLIQRDYSDVSLYDYYYHYDEGPDNHSDARLTDGGRTVYGGRGITPDLVVEDPKLTTVATNLLQRGAFFDFGKYYLGVHKSIPEDFVVTDEVLQEFKHFLETKKVKITDTDIKDNADFIKRHIRAQLVLVIYGEDKASKIGIENDYLVGQALEHLGQARDLMASAKRYMAARSVN